MLTSIPQRRLFENNEESTFLECSDSLSPKIPSILKKKFSDDYLNSIERKMSKIIKKEKSRSEKKGKNVKNARKCGSNLEIDEMLEKYSPYGSNMNISQQNSNFVERNPMGDNLAFLDFLLNEKSCASL